MNKVISREQLDLYLRSARPILVGFVKKDGTKRKMVVTQNQDFLPATAIIDEDGEKPVNEIAKKRKENNPDLVNVYAVHDKGWRSFDYNTLYMVSIDLTEGDTIPSYNGFHTEV